MKWKKDLHKVVVNYINRWGEEQLAIGEETAEMVGDWWAEVGPYIFGEFGWRMDEICDERKQQELIALQQLIEANPQIDNENVNTVRIMDYIDMLIKENEPLAEDFFESEEVEDAG